MYCTVRFLDGYERLLTYKVPDRLALDIVPGAVVCVPLRTHERYALVVSMGVKAQVRPDVTIREIVGLAQTPLDKHFYAFSQVLEKKYFCSSLYAYERIYQMLKQKQQEIVDVPVDLDSPDSSHIILTDEQQVVVDYLVPCVKDPAFEPVLIHGVTGSGKTEVYKRLIQEAIAQGKSVIFLLPEVSLAVQFYALFSCQLPGVSLYSFHSATPIPQKRELWNILCKGKKPVLVLGVHLPIFLPMTNLGLIIIDEEHEKGFLEKKLPRLNSKELALWRAKLYGVPIVLGSATPSLNSLYNVEKLGWKMFKITRRFSGAFPVIRKVLLTEEKKRKNFWVSKELEKAIRQTLDRKEQVIIYINRRGYSFFVQCKACGFIFQCPHCSVSLTYHTKNYQESLLCHYCDYSKILGKVCPDCKSNKEFLKKGIGTQQGVALLESLFPDARIARADLDSTAKKKSWRQTVEAFERQEIDILVGTQTITKGYHFPYVTLVGILWADLNLHFPIYDATEVTLQQLIQVAGRAGRQRMQSQVIVQALRDHIAFDFINETAYLDFCKQELEVRALVGYPPIARLGYIEMRNIDVDMVEREIQALYQELIHCAQKNNLMIDIKRPSMPAVHRIKKWEIRHIVIKAKRFDQLLKLCDTVKKGSYKSEFAIMTHQL